ncbi:hypothetical protein HOG21_00880 [bacterium]|nr:hypothetical protein [bacterium]
MSFLTVLNKANLFSDCSTAGVLSFDTRLIPSTNTFQIFLVILFLLNYKISFH